MSREQVNPNFVCNVDVGDADRTNVGVEGLYPVWSRHALRLGDVVRLPGTGAVRPAAGEARRNGCAFVVAATAGMAMCSGLVTRANRVGLVALRLRGVHSMRRPVVSCHAARMLVALQLKGVVRAP
jgi:hypothetical protein